MSLDWDSEALHGPVVACQMLCIIEDRKAFQSYARRMCVQAGTIVEWARLYNAFLLERAQPCDEVVNDG